MWNIYMPKTDIDYSNTVFYKIYCKDINFHDVYIGHTTNFVQRKHAHKRACNKSTDQSHNLKVYKIIREHGGWDNWNMEMIGFKNCKDHSEACTVEQEYFDSYEASLNSILAKKSIIERLPIAKEKLNLYCEVCKINSSCTKSFERHKKTKKHESLVKAKENTEMVTNGNTKNFVCEICAFKTQQNSDYERHISTAKHHKMTKLMTKNGNNDDMNTRHKCDCGNIYSSRQGLHRHKKKCNYDHNQEVVSNNDSASPVTESQPPTSTGVSDETMIAILQQTTELTNLVKEQQKQIQEQQEQHNKQIQDLISQLQ